LLLVFRVVVSRVQTDKASMLDDAIEYLKQLQLQVQVSRLMILHTLPLLDYQVPSS
jgi:hypothetical protein